MTYLEVEKYLNHKYGDLVYTLETEKYLKIFTPQSVWKIIKDDYARFNFYTLIHNSKQEGMFHVQIKGKDLGYLVFVAAMHDYHKEPYDIDAYRRFQQKYEIYQLGRSCVKRALKFLWICGEDANWT